MGTMTMELGGKVTIECSKTGYAADLEFKLRVRFNSLIQSWCFDYKNFQNKYHMNGGTLSRGKRPKKTAVVH